MNSRTSSRGQDHIHLLRAQLRELAVPVIAIVLALALGYVLMLLTGRDANTAMSALMRASFGSKRAFGEFLKQATPIILTGLSVALAFRCGLFNIGGEGQFLMAGLVAAVIGYAVPLPPVIHLLVVALAGMATAALWGSIAGILKARLGAHEVINTIMLNWIALRFTQWIVESHLRVPNLSRTPELLPTAQFRLILPPSGLSSGLLYALLAAALVYVFLWRTSTGYELRAVGHNPAAAQYGGISIGRNTVLAMALSGALAGLAGVIQTTTVTRAFWAPMGLPGYGFTGIAVALLGRNHALGVVLAALLFGFLDQGAPAMQAAAHVPKSIIQIVQATVVLLVAADAIIRRLLQRRQAAGAPPIAGQTAPVDGGTQEVTQP